MSTEINTSETETELFTNQQNSGLYVGTDSDGEHLYADPFASEDATSNHILTVGDRGMGKTYGAQSTALEWVEADEGRSLVVIERGDQFTPVVKWHGGVRYRTLENLPTTPYDVAHDHINLEPLRYQDETTVVNAVFAYLRAKVRGHQSGEMLVVIDDVDDLFCEREHDRFDSLLDALSRNDARAWLITQHPRRLFGTPPSGLTDEPAPLVRRFGTVQCFRTATQTSLLHQMGYTDEECEAIRHLDRHQCIVRGVTEERDSGERIHRDTQAVAIETAPEPAHSILTYNSSNDGGVLEYLNTVTEGGS